MATEYLHAVCCFRPGDVVTTNAVLKQFQDAIDEGASSLLKYVFYWSTVEGHLAHH